MKIFSTLLLSTSLILSLSSQSFASEYKVDPAHSSVNFSIRHLVSKVTGGFKDFDGEFNFDDKKPEATTGTFTAKTDSINTDNAKRDEHLKSEDFFDAKKNPTLTLTIKKLTKHGKDKFKAMGDLTMRGVTKPITLDVDYNGSTMFMGGKRSGFTATGVVNRKDFGINWNKALDQGGYILGDEVSLTLNIESGEKKADENKKLEKKEEEKKAK